MNYLLDKGAHLSSNQKYQIFRYNFSAVLHTKRFSTWTVPSQSGHCSFRTNPVPLYLGTTHFIDKLHLPIVLPFRGPASSPSPVLLIFSLRIYHTTVSSDILESLQPNNSVFPAFTTTKEFLVTTLAHREPKSISIVRIAASLHLFTSQLSSKSFLLLLSSRHPGRTSLFPSVQRLRFTLIFCD